MRFLGEGRVFPTSHTVFAIRIYEVKCLSTDHSFGIIPAFLEINSETFYISLADIKYVYLYI